MKINVESFLAELEDALVAQKGTLALEQGLSKIKEFDSISRLSVIAMCDSRYGFILKVPELDRCKTVQDLYEIAEKNATRA